MNRIPILVLTTSLLASGPLAAAESADEWKFDLMPYLWLPTISADLNYSLPPGTGGGKFGVSVGPTDWLELLNFGVLINGSASKGKLTIFGDLVFLSLDKDNGGKVVSADTVISGPGDSVSIPVGVSANLSTKSELKGGLYSIAAGYSFHVTESSTQSVFGGVRFLDLDVETSWSLSTDITTPGNMVVLPAQGGIKKSRKVLDGIVGLRGSYALGKGKWSIPYYFDVGAGDSDLTWTAQAGLAREFGWGHLVFGYRHLDYDEGTDGFLRNLTFSGPGIGARFSF